MVLAVTEMSPVPELMKFLKYAFREDDFAQVEKILSSREHGLKMDLEKLRDQYNLLKKDRDLMVEKHNLAVLEKCGLEDKVSTSKKKCEELKEMLERLNDREKRGEERFQKLGKKIMDIENETSQITVKFSEEMAGKNQIIDGLNEKLEVLKKEKNQLIVDYNEKLEVLNEKLEVLKKEKNQVIVNSNEKIESLKCVKLEIAGEKDAYKKKFEKVNQKVLKYDLLNEKFAEFEKEFEKVSAGVMVAVEDANVSKGMTLRGGEGSSAYKFVRYRGSVKVEKEIIYASVTIGGLGSGVHGSSDSQRKGPHPVDLDCDNGLLSQNLLISEAGCSSQPIPSSSKISGLLRSAPVIIDLSVGDEDVPAGGAASVGEKGVASVKSDNGHLALENVKTESNCRGSDFIPLCSKRKRNPSEIEDNDDIQINKLGTTSINKLNDKGKRSLPGGYSRMPESLAPNGISASTFDLPFIKQCEEKASIDQNHEKAAAGGSTWMYAADMLSAFMKDYELCMQAVCALYRQQISARKRIKGLSSLRGGGFNSLDAVKGTDLAKYLIDNDPEFKLRRSVSGMRLQMLADCHRLATQHYEQLFKIYQRKLDPFFCPKS